MADEDEVVVKYGIKVDQKSQKESEQASSNMISLISDLAIIGKVATDALGKMWSGVQSSVKASMDELESFNEGLIVDIDPQALKTLRYAIGAIGGTSKDVSNVVQQAGNMVQSFRNKATGVSTVEDFFEKNAKYGVDQKQIDKLNEAIESEDAMDVIKAFGELRNVLGNQYSEFAKDIGFSGLMNLEIPEQYNDWVVALEKGSSRLTEVNYDGLDAAADGINNLKLAVSAIKLDFVGDIGKDLEALSLAILGVTTHFLEWKDKLMGSEEAKGMNASANKLFGGDNSLAEDATGADKFNAWTGNAADYFMYLASMILKENYVPEGGSMGILEAVGANGDNGRVTTRDGADVPSIQIGEVNIKTDDIKGMTDEIYSHIGYGGFTE